jgi:hypothetical protein
VAWNIVYSPAITTTAEEGTIIFGDDFEARSVGSSPQFTAPPIAVGAAEWGPEDGGAASAVEIVGTGLNSNRSLRFRYLAGNSMAEQRYILDDTGAAQYRELWAEYDLFIPANWAPPSSFNNNKFFFFYNDDTGNTCFFDFETYRYGPEEPNPEGFTGLYLWHQMKRNGTNLGEIADDGGNPHGATMPLIDAVVDPGTWINLRFHVRMDSATGVYDGVTEVFKNGQTLWHRATSASYFSFNTGTNGGGHSNNHMSGGYILGAHNATFAADTDYQIDNFKVYSTRPGWGS